jgi:hypothetical protein
MGILLVGFMAIGFALVYRATRDAPPPTIAETVALPAGAEVVSSVVSEGRINVTYALEGLVTLALFDAATGELVREITLSAR